MFLVRIIIFRYMINSELIFMLCESWVNAYAFPIAQSQCNSDSRRGTCSCVPMNLETLKSGRLKHLSTTVRMSARCPIS